MRPRRILQMEKTRVPAFAATSYNGGSPCPSHSRCFHSTVKKYKCRCPALILESQDGCLYGRSSDSLQPGRLPVVHTADSGRSIARASK